MTALAKATPVDGNPSPLLLAVVGRPVLHSLSPLLHEAGLAALGLEGHYLRLAAPSGASALRTARAMGLRGFNVTAPFKEDLATLVDELDPEARALGAVNTVLLDQDGRARGFNTDVDGVALALRDCPLDGATAVVLGSGGAAKAAVRALQRAGVGVTLLNRTQSKAHAVAEGLSCRWGGLDSATVARALAGARVLVNTTDTCERILSPDVLHRGLTVLDATYRTETALLADAGARGCRILDGRDWLLYQGARAFELFTGCPAPVEAMGAALRTEGSSRPGKSIALVGFMGCGKTATSLLLGKKLGQPVVDLDEAIEQTSGHPIPDLFHHHGEPAFRDLETRILVRALGGEVSVIACGGGIVERDENLRLLRDQATVVWLWSGLETLLKRTARSRHRPLLEVDDRAAAARSLLARRLPRYASAADLVIATDDLPVADVAWRIRQEVGS